MFFWLTAKLWCFDIVVFRNKLWADDMAAYDINFVINECAGSANVFHTSVEGMLSIHACLNIDFF